MPDPSEVSCFCSSLVVVVSADENAHDTESDTSRKYGNMVLQLAHLSVKDYLTAGRLEAKTAQYFKEIPARALISSICLAYLSQLDGDIPAKVIRINHPFAQYCATYWMAHAAAVEGNDETLQGFLARFFSETKAYKVCYKLYQPDRASYY